MKRTFAVLIVILLLLTSCGTWNSKKCSSENQGESNSNTQETKVLGGKDAETDIIVTDSETGIIGGADAETNILITDLEDNEDEIKDFIKSINRDDIIQSGLIITEPIYRFNNPKFNYNLHNNVFIGKVIELKEGVTIIESIDDGQGHNPIRTPAVIKVKKVFKGNHSEGDYLDIYIFGGIMNLGKYMDSKVESEFKCITKEEAISKYSEEELKTKYVELKYEDEIMPEAGKTYIFYTTEDESYTWILTSKEGLKEIDPKTGVITGFDGITINEKIDEFVEKYFVEDEEMIKAIETRKVDPVLKYFEVD